VSVIFCAAEEPALEERGHAEKCATMEAAKEALATLPFVQLDLIDFDLIPLAPFRGLTRFARVLTTVLQAAKASPLPTRIPCAQACAGHGS